MLRVLQLAEDKGATLSPSDLETVMEEKDDTETSAKRDDLCLHSPRLHLPGGEEYKASL